MKNNFLEMYKGFAIRKETFDGVEEYYSSKGMFAISRKTIEGIKKAIDEGFLD